MATEIERDAEMTEREISDAARTALAAYLRSKREFEEAEENYKRKQKLARETGRQVLAVAESFDRTLAFLGKGNQHYLLIPIRSGAVALKRVPVSWSLEDRLLVDATDLLKDGLS